MNSSLTGLSVIVIIFGACIWVFLILVVLGQVILKKYAWQQEMQHSAWESLATRHNLIVETYGFLPGLEVVGIYRGYRLKLETARKLRGRHGEICTRLTLSVGNVEPDARSELEMSLSIEDIIDLFDLADFGYRADKEVKAAPNGRKIVFEQLGVLANSKNLQFWFDWLSDLMDAYPAIVFLGGEVAPTLADIASRDPMLRPVTMRLLRHIAFDTKQRLSVNTVHLFCPECLTSCDTHQVQPTWLGRVVYYGCRTCHQSQGFYFAERVVVVLDETMTLDVTEQNNILQVNWLVRSYPFDFDEVHILRASDEEVERFAVQIGNDTEPVRRTKYPKMRCLVSPTCELSPNTHRILERTFGAVQVHPS